MNLNESNKGKKKHTHTQKQEHTWTRTHDLFVVTLYHNHLTTCSQLDGTKRLIICISTC